MLLMTKLTLPTGSTTLAEGVVEAVRSGIGDGELVPEETYSVYLLANLLGISRSPVREGILRLAEAGLVEINRNRGFRVRLPNARDIEEIIEIRLDLEPPGARRAAKRGTTELHAEVSRAFTIMSSAAATEDTVAFWPADRALHDVLLRAAGNARAATIVNQLRATTALLGPPTTISGRTLTEIVAEHAPVVDAVLARDGSVAETAMRHHLEETGRLLANHLR